MNKGKSSISKAKSYNEIGSFWDTHNLADYWNQTRSAAFEVDISSEITYYALDRSLSDWVRNIAQKRGISADTLLNLWVQEKLKEQRT